MTTDQDQREAGRKEMNMSENKHTPGRLRIMADPDYAGKHPLHDNRFLVTEGSKTKFGYDPRPGQWCVSDGIIVCAMRDHSRQAADARRIVALWNAAAELGLSTEAIECRANVRLIAAATELLEALKMVIRHGSAVQHSDQLMFEVLSAARAAIAKAEGGSNKTLSDQVNRQEKTP